MEPIDYAVPADRLETRIAAKPALTPAEARAVAENLSAEALREKALVHQKYVEAYADVDMKEARRGVRAAIAVRDACLAQLKVLRGAEVKLEQLAREFDARGFAMAKEAERAERLQ